MDNAMVGLNCMKCGGFIFGLLRQQVHRIAVPASDQGWSHRHLHALSI